MKSERRQFERVGQPFEIAYRRRGVMADEWQSGIILNLSAGGLRFHADAVYELGQELEFRMELPALSRPLEVFGAVAWSQLRAAGVTEYGVAFLELSVDQQIAVDELVQFLLTRSRPSAPPATG